MTTPIGDIINQYFPHLIFPLILPTQIPNTFIVFKSEVNAAFRSTLDPTETPSHLL
jgi:hypothetical protein